MSDSEPRRTGDESEYTAPQFGVYMPQFRIDPAAIISRTQAGGGKQLTMPLVERHADWWNCLGNARIRLSELAPLRGNARISAQYAVGVVDTEEHRDEVTAKIGRRMLKSAWGKSLIGKPDELVNLFRTERELGVELFIVRFHDLGTEATLELFGKEVAAPLKVTTHLTGALV